MESAGTVVPSERHPSRSASQHRGFWKRAIRSRYSLKKASSFLTYAHEASVLRQIIIVVAAPLSGLALALILALIPLQNPALGPFANPGICCHGFCVLFAHMVGVLGHVRAVTDISKADFMNREVFQVALMGALPCTAFGALLALTWRFPTPFVCMMVAIPWIIFVVARLRLVLRDRVRKGRILRERLQSYVPALGVQMLQLAVYGTYSIAFITANQWLQILLIGVFPCIKFLFKRGIQAKSKHLGDHSSEVVVSGVEITASMYQTIIMQAIPSPLTTALIITADISLLFIEVERHLKANRIVTTKTIARCLEGDGNHVSEQELARLGSRKAQILPSFVSNTFQRSICCKQQRAAKRIAPVNARKSTSLSKSDARDLVVALETLQSAEAILLVEYLEVAVPILNVAYVAVASQFESALYNPNLRKFHLDNAALLGSTTRILSYTVLQAFTLLGIGLIIRHRFRFSALTLLAFVLETHAWSLQGKIAAALVAILAMPIVHYGLDFTFKFTTNFE